MANISGYEGWTFNVCNAINGKYMQVGTDSSLGSFCTPALGIYGNASLLIETTRVYSTAKFKVSIVDGGGTTSTTEYSVASDNGIHHSSAILIHNCTPSSRVKIEGTSGYFFVVTMKVFAIDDAIFYESFDYMNGRAKEYEFYTSNTEASSAFCDNSICTSITGIKSSYKSVYLENAGGNYVLSSIPVPSQSKVLLTFAIGHTSNTNRVTVTCSNDARITDFNSSDLGTLDISHMISSLEEPYRIWKPYSMVISNMSESTSLTFNGANMCLNDVKLTLIPINLDQSKNNNTYIIANAGQTLNVPLVRTFKAGIWCPLCLPFEVSKEKMEEATGTTCELCILDRVESGIFVFENATTIPAGTPFLVKVPKDVVNPTFSGVTIENTPAATATASTENYQFVGTYSPVDLETDGTNLFLATDGALYKPTTDGNRLGGLRAYFVVPATDEARVMIPEIVSDIRSPRDVTPPTKYEIYDLRGQRVNNLNSKGLFIHNGKRIFIH